MNLKTQLEEIILLVVGAIPFGVGIGIPIIVSKKLRNRKIEKIIQMNFRVDKVDNKE